MEQNKLLMVIISVGIFFTAIIGVGVALLYPRSTPDTIITTTNTTPEFDPIEYVRSAETAPLQTEQKTEDNVITLGVETPGNAEPIDNAEITDNRAIPEVQKPTEVSTTAFPIPRPSKETTVQPPAKVIQSPSVPAHTKPVSTPSIQKPVPAEKRPVPKPTQTVEVSSKPVKKTSTPIRNVRKQTKVTEYWIQLVASPSRDRVEQARLSLEDHNIGGKLTTKTVQGTLYYRLRIGPYASKEEAVQALQWMQSIQGFETAYISEEYYTRNG